MIRIEPRHGTSRAIAFGVPILSAVFLQTVDTLLLYPSPQKTASLTGVFSLK